MSQDIAIRARGLGKRYKRGSLLSRHNSLRDVVREKFGNLLHPREAKAKASNAFWALEDASFDIARGESVGIIGLNGAGKSTLLKILSQITTPTTGNARIVGRLGALLEVGTGFHRELTGRENTYLYGAILGMGRAEVSRKFDTIVDFAEIAEFIDTPVKHYSSGMYVRLAFSVAAHLDPDILLLDEVLAVGDYTFQKKCLDFATQLERNGATILFVSHNMFSIKSMCERVIYLKKGRVYFDGPTDEGLKLYAEDCRLAVSPWFYTEAETPPIVVRSFEIMDENGQEKSVFDLGERMTVRVRYDIEREVDAPNFLVSLTRSDEVLCCNFSSTGDGVKVPGTKGPGVIEIRTPPLNLTSDMYMVQVTVRERDFGQLVCAQIGTHIHVRHPIFTPNGFGVFYSPSEWRFNPPALGSQQSSA